MEKNSSNYRLLSGLFFRLLPFQVLLLIITSVNGIVDSLYASNQIGQTAMSAIGLFGPLNHFLYAASIMFVSGSQVLYGRYLARDRGKINHLFTVLLVISGGLGLLTSSPAHRKERLPRVSALFGTDQIVQFQNNLPHYIGPVFSQD